MPRILKRRLAVLALMIGLVAGGAMVAVAATGGSPNANHGAPATHRPLLLATAADYLGLSRGDLQSRLHSGQTLGQIASATGKSEAGLEQALGQVAGSNLQARVASSATAAKAKHKRLAHSLRNVAASYLGLTPVALGTQLKAGKTLAQIAASTPGRSVSGLVDALVAARQQSAPAHAKNNKGATTAQRLAHLRKRVEAFVHKSRTKSQSKGKSSSPTHTNH
jgi:hypothetical protein